MTIIYTICKLLARPGPVLQFAIFILLSRCNLLQVLICLSHSLFVCFMSVCPYLSPSARRDITHSLSNIPPFPVSRALLLWIKSCLKDRIDAPNSIEIGSAVLMIMTRVMKNVWRVWRAITAIMNGLSRRWEIDICRFRPIGALVIGISTFILTLKEPGYFDPSHSRRGADSAPPLRSRKTIDETSSVWY